MNSKFSNVAVFSAALLSSLAFGGTHEKPEWFECKVDADCVDIFYPCAGATVNKRFEKEAHDLYRDENAARDCAVDPSPEKPLPPFKVFCKAGKCGKQGRNPKMGFS